MSPKSWMSPFLATLAGVGSDYATTVVGLGMGFCETNPHYHPFWALLFFSVAAAILASTLPSEKPWNLAAKALALLSFLGAANNILVLLG